MNAHHLMLGNVRAMETTVMIVLITTLMNAVFVMAMELMQIKMDYVIIWI